MLTDAYSNPLQTIIEEIKKISPETSNVLIFKNNGQTIANAQIITENQTNEVITNFASIAVQAETIGGIENFTIQAADNQLNIFAVDNCFLATVSSRTANQEILKSLTQVVVPTVVRLVYQVGDHAENQSQGTEQGVIKPNVENVLLTEEELEPTVEPIPEPQPPYEPFLPKTPTNQFMVEKICGLLVPADTVRIDGEIAKKWSDLYEGKQFNMVIIEALDGKKTTCKFKTIKESNKNAKGIIQIPEKILQTLQTEKGKLVIVKPVIE
jgi:hypothetical protein